MPALQETFSVVMVLGPSKELKEIQSNYLYYHDIACNFPIQFTELILLPIAFIFHSVNINMFSFFLGSKRSCKNTTTVEADGKK